MPAISESAFLRQVVDLALVGGWRVHHVENSTRLIQRRSGAVVRVRNIIGHSGAPDLLLVNARRKLLVFAELKRGKQRGHHHSVTPAQKDWLDDLRAVAEASMVFGSPRATIGVYVWTPADYDEVHRVLIERSDP